MSAMEFADRSVRARSFGAIAAEYDRFRPPPPDALVEWVLPARCDAALDIGAGTGALTRAVVAHSGSVTALEPDRRMSAVLAARETRARVVSARAEQLPVRDGCLDAVVGSSMWHWVDEAVAATEAARVLRPGGVLGLLWSGPDRSQGWLAEVLGGAARALVERVERGELGEGAAVDQPRGTRRHRHEVHLPPGAPFAEPETRVLAWTLTVTPAQLVGMAGTYSGFIVLPDDEKARVLEGVADAVRNHPRLADRDEIELPMRATAWRAVRNA
jgi:SAM-dependent methyltransferase